MATAKTSATRSKPQPRKAPAKASGPRRAFRGLAHDERQRQRREKLLEAALEAFGSRGFHGVTVREVCAGAKLTERYFYESFKSLEQLFLALFSELNAEVKARTLEALTALRNATDVAALAEAAIRVLLETIERDPRKARVLLIDAVSISHDVQRASGEVTRDYAKLLRGFIDLLYPDAKARGADPDVIAAGLLGANIHIATHWVRERFATPLETVLANNVLFYRALGEHWRKASESKPSRASVQPR